MESQGEDFKTKGNEYFKGIVINQDKNYEKAVELYTNAIECNLDGKYTAVYLSNRAFCHIKMENYGLAVQDAEAAIIANPEYAKAYYRKADACIALSQYEQAQKFLKKLVMEFKVNDQDAKDKYNFVRKTIREKAFQEAISADEKYEDQIDVKSIKVEEGYSGPKIEEDCTINSDWVVKLIEYFKDQKKLHKKYAIMLIQQAKDILTKQNTLVDLDIPKDQQITVCGDTHGQFYDLANIFKINGIPSELNPYLFNGDFVDRYLKQIRGSFSVEVILTLLAWKVALPNSMHLTRGNHESRNMTKLYGQFYKTRFEGEVLHKYDSRTYEQFISCFQALPLAYVLQKKVFVCHGGLFQEENVTLADITKTNRFREIPDSGIMCDLLWADPCPQKGRQVSKRGISIQFGPDITAKFLSDNNLEFLVRSHETKDQGYEEDHDGKLCTIFSAPNYCDQMRNKGAFITFKGSNMKPTYTQFECVDHPKIPPMAYANKFLNGVY